MIKVVHHFFEKTSTGFPFRGEDDEMAFAILGLDNETLVVEVPYGLFTKGSKPAMATLHLKDFKNATGHQGKFDLLSAVDPKGITKADLEKGEDSHGEPLPVMVARKVGGVIPPFLISCFALAIPSEVLFDCLKKVSDYIKTNLTEEAGEEFWKACYPFLQRLWIMTVNRSSDNFALFTVDPALLETDNNLSLIHI